MTVDQGPAPSGGVDIPDLSQECRDGAAHTWDALGNAKYRCSTCGAFGYRRAITQHLRSMKTDRQGIRTRGCEKTVSGTTCKKPAVARDEVNHGRSKSWRCGEHRL